MEKIEAKEIEFVCSGGDAGNTYKIQCPECKQTIEVAECGWWNAVCSCDYTWDLVITAYGTK